MKRLNLGDGRWFDEDRAEQFKEDTRWDGSNQISVPTGSQWDHECLFKTASGTWVLNQWSQRQGSLETYEIVPDAEAYRWLIQNGHYDAVPADALADQEV